MAGDTYQKHSGSGHNIGRFEVMHIGQPRFSLTDEVKAQVLNTIDRSRPVAISTRPFGRNLAVVEELTVFLHDSSVDLHAGRINWPNGWPEAITPILYLPEGFRRSASRFGDPVQTLYVDAYL